MKKGLIDINELSESTGLSTSTMYSWVSQKRIPYVKCGSSTRFDLERIDEWTKKNSVEKKRFLGWNGSTLTSEVKSLQY